MWINHQTLVAASELRKVYPQFKDVEVI